MGILDKKVVLITSTGGGLGHYIRKARRRKVAQSARTLLIFDRDENEIVPLSGVERGGTKRAKKSK